jgi:hypothetical protein
MPNVIDNNVAATTEAQTIAETPEKDLIASETRFKDQCFLVHNIVPISTIQKTATYENIAVLEGESSLLINKIFQLSKIKDLMELTPLHYSYLVPKLRFYKINSIDLKVIGEKEFIFDSYLNENDLKILLQSHSGRPNSAGVKSFTYEWFTDTVAESTTTVKANLKLFFHNFEGLMAEGDDEAPSYLDFFSISEPTEKTGDFYSPEQVQPMNSANISDSSKVQIKAEIGWAISPDKIGLFSSELIAAIERSNETLLLSLSKHTLSFEQDGSITVDLEYFGYQDTLLNNRKMNIFAYDTLSEKAQNGLINPIVSTAFAPFEALDNAVAGLNRAQEGYLENSLKETTKFDEKTKQDLQRYFEVKSINSDRIAAKYRKILDYLSSKNKVKIIELSESEILLWLAKMKSLKNFINFVDAQGGGLGEGWLKLYEEQELAQPNNLGTVNENMSWVGETGDVNNNSEQQHKDSDQEKRLLRDQINAIEARRIETRGTITSVRSLTLKEEVEKSVLQTQLDFKNLESTGNNSPTALNNYRIRFIFFGDLIDSILHNVQVKLKDINLKIIFGPMNWVNPQDPKDRREINLADFPIALELFNAWFADNIINKTVKNLTIKEFMTMAINGLIMPSLREDCFANGSDIITRQNGVISTIPFASKKDYFKIGQRTQVTSLEKQEISVSRTNTKDIDNCIMIYINEFSPPNLKGDISEDEENGVFHFSIGQDRGLLKNIEFNQVTDTHLMANNIVNASGQGESFMKFPYNATLKLFGNNFFKPGSIIFINPSIMGFGTRANREILLRNLSIGGYYVVKKVNFEFSNDTYETSLDCIWQGLHGLGGTKIDSNAKKSISSPPVEDNRLISSSPDDIQSIDEGTLFNQSI